MAMIPVDDALAIALDVVARGARATTTKTRVERSANRVSAEDVRATTPHPAFAASVMDGYALNARASAAAMRANDDGGATRRWEFEIVDDEASRAGPAKATRDDEGREFGAMECAYVTTGAVLPRGCDCVVPEEACEVVREGSGRARADSSDVVSGKWTRAVGSDVRGRGEVLIAKGERLSAYDVGVLKYARDVVETYEPPRVRVLSTGDELAASASDVAVRGCVVDTNGPMLEALCGEEGAEVISRDIVRDDEAATRAAFEMAVADASCDALITSGGASVGDRDFVKQTIEGLGGKIYFRRLAMKPGKPTMFATIPRATGPPLLVFALPGNPVSAAVTFTLIVAPCLRALGGVRESGLRRIHCVLDETLRLDPERAEYHRVTLDWTRGNLPVARSTGAQISSRLLSMRNADALIELPRGPGVVEKGAIASALLISDVRHAKGANMEKIQWPKKSRGDESRRSNEALDSIVTVLDAEGSVRDLKRVVGLEEDARRHCRAAGDCVDALNKLKMYSDGDSTHVAVTDAQSPGLRRGIATTLERLRVVTPIGDVITKRAYARVGLVGNPSDAYGGKCVAFTISNFFAEASLRRTPSSKRVTFAPGPYDGNAFDSFDALSTHVSQHGVDGGVRLLKSLCCNLMRYCESTKQRIDTSCGFEMSYTSNIPKQTGLSGSSAIVIAAMRCLLEMYRINISLDDQTELALRVERDVGINAGPMDRVAQVYEGAVFMDFTKPRASTACGWRIHGEYTRVETDELPPLYLVWAKDNESESSRIHADVRRRWDAGDADVATSMSRLASLADDVFKAMATRQINVEELKTSIDTNFDIRRALFGDQALGALNVTLVSVCRERAGCAAKFAGSGGACVVVCENDDRARALKEACDAHGFEVERVVVRK